MKLYLLIILSLTSTLSFAQHRQRLMMNDLNRLGLKGEVESLTHIDYQPIEQDDTSQLEIDHFILAPNNYTIQLDNQGYILKKIEYEYLRKQDSLKEKGLWNYKYDSNHRIIREKYIWNNYSKDTTIWVYEYLGDSVTIVHQYDDTYKHLVYRYAQRGNREYLTTANSDSSYLTRQIFTYDKQNRMIRKEEYEDQNTITFIRSFDYSDSLIHNPTLDVGISAKYDYGPIIIINKYDSLGSLILSKGIESKSTKKIEYTYDKTGNWVERRMLLPNSLIKISRRTIIYYDK